MVNIQVIKNLIYTQLLELIDESQRLARLQRKLDRQMRANNPHRYNDDGTIKRGRGRWVYSKETLATKEEIAEVQRIQATQRKIDHQTLANEIVQMGDRFVVEQMSFKGLQARAKETEISETTGRFKRKGRFGKSILNHAPTMLIEMIRYKAQFQDKQFIKANTRKVKASQLDHISGQYKKYRLSTRAKTIGDELVQRDLYSAFILQHVMDDGETVDLIACDDDFDTFVRNQEQTMMYCDTNLTSAGKKYFKNIE